MRLLIAGGAGYVGSTLIPKLLDRGYKVDVVDLFWFGNHLPRQTGILNKDIFHLTIEDLEPYDQVIFLAGLSNDPMAEYSPNKNFIFNAAAPSYLAYIAKKASVSAISTRALAPSTGTRRTSCTMRRAPSAPPILTAFPNFRASRRRCNWPTRAFLSSHCARARFPATALGCASTSSSTRCSRAP